jgi:hypothetical protein
MSYDSEFQVWTQGYTIAQGGQSRFERSPQNTPFLKPINLTISWFRGIARREKKKRGSFTLFLFVIRYIMMKWEGKCFRKYISKVAWGNFPKIDWWSKLRLPPTNLVLRIFARGKDYHTKS